MSEPLHEEVEQSWIEFLNRFDAEIYPTLFEKRGFTKGEAMIIWNLSKIEAQLDEVLENKSL